MSVIDQAAEVAHAVAAILGARPVFKAGDRVRVRANLECGYCFDQRYPSCNDVALANDGRIGRVYEVEAPGSHPCTTMRCDREPDQGADRHAHNIWVKFETRMPHDQEEGDTYSYPFDTHFAPPELELIATAEVATPGDTP
jgi:hypothetical protein